MLLRLRKDFLGGPVVDSTLPVLGVWIDPRQELRSHTLRGSAKTKTNKG